MTDLMAKDLDLAIGFAARANTPLFTSGIVRQLLAAASAAGYGRRTSPRWARSSASSAECEGGSGGGTRTRSRRLNRPLLHQLSYPGMVSATIVEHA